MTAATKAPAYGCQPAMSVGREPCAGVDVQFDAIAAESFSRRHDQRTWTMSIFLPVTQTGKQLEA